MAQASAVARRASGAAVVATAAVGIGLLTRRVSSRPRGELSGFRSPEGESRYLRAYEEVLAQRSAPTTGSSPSTSSGRPESRSRPESFGTDRTACIGSPLSSTALDFSGRTWPAGPSVDGQRSDRAIPAAGAPRTPRAADDVAGVPVQRDPHSAVHPRRPVLQSRRPTRQRLPGTLHRGGTPVDPNPGSPARGRPEVDLRSAACGCRGSAPRPARRCPPRARVGHMIAMEASDVVNVEMLRFLGG
jgi:hypothetical protein